jgi:hypothetical protein
MALLDIIGGGVLWFWNFFLDWLYIFISPIENFQVLWIIIPVWISWFFGEFFQEKHGTNLGNALSNGVIPIWVAIDWTRLLSNQLSDGIIQLTPQVVMKLGICAAVLIYGITVITLGIRGHPFAPLIGRVREVTYVMVCFTPIIYGIIVLSWSFFLGVVVFFPLFYYAIEMIDTYTPDPKALEMDSRK